MILHECDEIGARLATKRLNEFLAGGVRVGNDKILVKPHYGYSSQYTRDTDRASKLLTSAEQSLKALVQS
jgi:hypothetical protein